MEVVVFLIKEGFPLPIFITENQHLNLNHNIYPRTTRFNISQHKPIQPPSQKKPYNHTPRRYVVLWIPFSLHTNRSKNYLLLITRHWKSELLTPLKMIFWTWLLDLWQLASHRAPSRSPVVPTINSYGSNYHASWLFLQRCSSTYPVPANAAIIHLGF